MQPLRTTALATVIIAALTAAVSAHYLWVVVDHKEAGSGTAHIYFEEGPAARDGKYLGPFEKRGKTWLRTAARPEPVELKTRVAEQPGKRWLTATLTDLPPRSVDSYGKWGVYRYGKTDVLLHYYARCIDVTSAKQLHALARAEQMKLDIVPKHRTESLDLTVLWQGKPAAGRPMRVAGPGGFKANLKTDEAGRVRVKFAGQGRYTFRSSVDEPDSAGVEGGKPYELTRHHATMILTLPLAE